MELSQGTQYLTSFTELTATISKSMNVFLHFSYCQMTLSYKEKFVFPIEKKKKDNNETLTRNTPEKGNLSLVY